MAKKNRRFVRMAKLDRKNLKLWAEGAREQVLLPHIPAYADALDRGWKAERDYFEGVCNEYHARIDWRLEDHEEPKTLPSYDPTKVLPEENLNPFERSRKLSRIKALNERIRRWLKYRVRQHKNLFIPTMDPKKNPYAALVAKLVGINQPPKARQAYQQFMVERYSTDIEPEVKKRWRSKILEEKLAADTVPNAGFRAKVARDMYAQLPPHEQTAFSKRAKQEASKARSEYDKEMKREPTLEPRNIQRCSDNIPAFLGPIINGIQKRTRYKFFIMYGGPVPHSDGKIETFHINYGRSCSGAPSIFSHFENQAFERVVEPLFHRWLKTCYTEQDIALAALDENEPPRPFVEESDSESDSSFDDSSSDDEMEIDDTSRMIGRGRTKGKEKGKRLQHPPAKDGEGGVNVPSTAKSRGKKRSTSPNDGAGSFRKRTKVSHVQSSSNLPAPPAATTPIPPPATPIPPPAASTLIPPPAASTIIFPAPPLPASATATAAPSHPQVPSPSTPIIPVATSTRQNAGLVLSPTPRNPVTPYQTTVNPMDLGIITQQQVPFDDGDVEMGSPLLPPSNSSLPSPSPPPKTNSLANTSSHPATIPNTATSTQIHVAFVQQAPSEPSSSSSTPILSSSNSNPPAPTPPDPMSFPPPPISLPLVINTQAPTPPSYSVPICPPGADPWFKDAFDAVSSKDLGPDFAEILRHFIVIEARYGYSNPTRGLPTRGRPNELQRWVSGGRWRVRDPVVTDVGSYARTWWTWWRSLQPAWCLFAVDGKPIASTLTPYGEDWSALKYPGQNGVLSIIATLFWWGSAVIEDDPSSSGLYADWLAAVCDVAWLLTGYVSHLG